MYFHKVNKLIVPRTNALCEIVIDNKYNLVSCADDVPVEVQHCHPRHPVAAVHAGRTHFHAVLPHDERLQNPALVDHLLIDLRRHAAHQHPLLRRAAVRRRPQRRLQRPRHVDVGVVDRKVQLDRGTRQVNKRAGGHIKSTK